ncbi:MAG TPA: ABC transporter permease [Gaiellaceae bacterium]|nr:ABC transporter permease [Gaiellaceae bacterium]
MAILRREMAAAAESRVTVIQPPRGWGSINLRELWEFREILYFLVWRDVKIRYKQTAIGAAWVLLQPLLTATIFTVVFGRFAGLPSGGVPYAVMVYAGLLPWFVFANALTFSTRSIVENQALVTKVYVPRLFLPLVAVLAGLVDFLIGGVFLVGLMAWYGIVPPLQALTLPLFVLFLVVTAVAVTLWLSALNVRYRDVQYTVPFLTQAWLFATPVAYSALVFPESVRTWIGLNPMAGVVQGFRWALLGDEAGGVGAQVLLSAAIVLVLLVGGIAYFRRVERSFADVV